MNNPRQRPPSYFGKTEVAEPLVKKSVYVGPALSWFVQYTNNLSVPVWVQWRSGLKLKLEPEPSLESQRLTVRVEIQINHQVKVDALRLLSAVGPGSSAELSAIREALALEMRQNLHPGVTLRLDYPVTAAELDAHGGSLYYHELDVVLSTAKNAEDVPPHPFSAEWLNEQLVADRAEHLKEAGFGYALTMVDSARRHGVRFTNIAGKVYKILAVTDWHRRDGIYVVSPPPAQGAYDAWGPSTRFFSFEEAEKELGLFKTIEEAATMGDLAVALKRELADKEHAVVVAKRDLSELQARHSVESALQAREIENLKAQHERDKLEMERTKALEEQERQRLKEYYEQRSQTRKDSSEMLKMVPAVIIAVAAILGVIKAFSK